MTKPKLSPVIVCNFFQTVLTRHQKSRSQSVYKLWTTASSRFTRRSRQASLRSFAISTNCKLLPNITVLQIKGCQKIKTLSVCPLIQCEPKSFTASPQFCQTSSPPMSKSDSLFCQLFSFLDYKTCTNYAHVIARHNHIRWQNRHHLVASRSPSPKTFADAGDGKLGTNSRCTSSRSVTYEWPKSSL